MSDNGSAFTLRNFTEHLSNYHQISKFAGVGAHHHNAIAERSIRTIMSVAFTIMMHIVIHWPDMAKNYTLAHGSITCLLPLESRPGSLQQSLTT